MNFVLPLCLGNTARHPQLLHPSAGELNYTRRDRVKGSPREYTHIHNGHTRGHLKKGERERFVTRLTPVVFPMQWDAFYLNENRKWVKKKY